MTIEQAISIIEKVDICCNQAETARNMAIDALLEKADRGWISVKDRNPETGSRCLVVRYDQVTKTYFEDILWFDNGNWWNRHYDGDYAVTHWMPLPDLPKEA